jgi:metallophosphoesterase (TIGR03768 family)
MRHGYLKAVILLFSATLPLQLTGCPSPLPVEWPIAKKVYTTAERQILPVAIPPGAPQLNPADVADYAKYGYSAYQVGAGTNYSNVPGEVQPYDKRTDLAPDYTGATNAGRLLTFFSMSDVHISDKESPAQGLYAGWTAAYGLYSTGMTTCYSPVFLSMPQVLDAAVQTVNALNKKTPFDFGIALGDAINNTQYNELRWYIDVFDGKIITPSSGAHAGACSIDYQKPFKAAGLDKSIPWYQVVGNHDQFWMGFAYESVKTLQAHVGNTVINVGTNMADPNIVNETGLYMGVIDGSTPYGDVIKAGLSADFETPPMVAPDPNRRSLATLTSSTHNWMGEFFKTTTKPVGHGFTQANLDADSACYSFEPKSDIPLKVIVLDDTPKGAGQPNYALGVLDQPRLDWLQAELQEGQDNGKLMIIAAHVPVNPQASLDPRSAKVAQFSSSSVVSDQALLDILHTYPNLILWIAGHRHKNVVTPQPYNPAVQGQGPENSFWEVETASFLDFPHQFRTFDIRRNSDNTLSIFVTNVDPAVRAGSPAGKSLGYSVATERIYGATPQIVADTTSHAYNAELIIQLTPEMQAKIAACSTPLE